MAEAKESNLRDAIYIESEGCASIGIAQGKAPFLLCNVRCEHPCNKCPALYLFAAFDFMAMFCLNSIMIL